MTVMRISAYMGQDSLSDAVALAAGVADVRVARDVDREIIDRYSDAANEAIRLPDINSSKEQVLARAASVKTASAP